MAVTEEDGGRLNAFAKEPQIEVINSESSRGNSFRLLIALGILLLIALITAKVTIS